MSDESSSTIRIVRPGDSDYDQSRNVWNARFNDRQPSEIMYCYSVKDVQTALKQVLDAQTPFRVRSGGHCYEGYSLSKEGAVIDVSNMNTVSVANGIATIGAGAKLQDVYKALGQTPIPGGTCPSVGITGLATGGGLGMLLRAEGLLSDKLVQVNVVIADGTEIAATADSDSELFWACRGGGGGNFGIVTSLQFQTVEVGDVTVFRYIFDISQLVQVMQAWQSWAPAQATELSCIVTLYVQDKQILIFGQYNGPEADARKCLDRFKPGVKPIQNPDILQQSSYYQAVLQIADWEGMVSSKPDPVRAIGATSFAYKALPKDGWQALSDQITIATNKGLTGAGPTLYPMQGAVTQIKPEDTAFPYRNALMLLCYQANWPDQSNDDSYKQWIQDTRNALLPYTSNDCYVNIPDRSLKDYMTAYYGTNATCLTKVKSKYDPGNVFQYKQGIPLAAPSTT
jgi:FAD/FMN-containing dehydrogenase